AGGTIDLNAVGAQHEWFLWAAVTVSPNRDVFGVIGMHSGPLVAVTTSRDHAESCPQDENKGEWQKTTHGPNLTRMTLTSAQNAVYFVWRGHESGEICT